MAFSEGRSTKIDESQLLEDNDFNIIEQCATMLLDVISHSVLELLSMHRIVSATVQSYNENTHTATVIPITGDGKWSNVKNQTIYRTLKAGDCVKLFCQDGNPNNSWIFAVIDPKNEKKAIGDELMDYCMTLAKQCETLNSRVETLEKKVAILESKETV